MFVSKTVERFDGNSSKLHIQVSRLEAPVVQVELGLAKHGIVLKRLSQLLVASPVVVLVQELNGLRLLTLAGWQVAVFHSLSNWQKLLRWVMILSPVWFQSAFLSLKLDLILNLLPGLLSIINFAFLCISHLRFRVELRKEVWIIGGVSLELAHEVLLVEAQFEVSKLVILGILIWILFWLHNLSTLVKDIHVCLGEMHLRVKDCWHMEFSDKSFPLLHDLPWIGLGIF